MRDKGIYLLVYWCWMNFKRWRIKFGTKLEMVIKYIEWNQCKKVNKFIHSHMNWSLTNWFMSLFNRDKINKLLFLADNIIQACLHFQQTLSIEAQPSSCLWVRNKFLRASSKSRFGVYIIQDLLKNDLVDAHFWGLLMSWSLRIFPRNLFQVE